MHVTYLSLRDFRSYETVELSLGPGATAFVGPNGHGKTNLLEAVGYVATLRSRRVAHDGPLVRAGADRAVVRAGISSVVSTDRTADRTGRSTLVEIEINPGRTNRARLNRAPVTRPREVLGALRAVHFSPDDLALVQGDPAERRRFLDETLVARAPRHAAVRADYDRALKQRSALLKSAAAVRGKPGKPGPRGRGGEQGEDIGHTLDVWDAHLARAGAQLLAARLELLSELRPLVGRAYAALAGAGASTRMSYASTLGPDAGGEPGLSGQPETDLEALETALRSELLRNRPAEMERGVSLVGPHRDDLALALDGLPARGYASHGESWSLAFALRLAAYELLRDDGIEPVLLLDDVFAELDSLRRDRLAGLVAPAEQVLVTAAYADDVPGALADVRMEVSGGRVHGPGKGEGSAASG